MERRKLFESQIWVSGKAPQLPTSTFNEESNLLELQFLNWMAFTCPPRCIILSSTLFSVVGSWPVLSMTMSSDVFVRWLPFKFGHGESKRRLEGSEAWCYFSTSLAASSLASSVIWLKITFLKSSCLTNLLPESRVAFHFLLLCFEPGCGNSFVMTSPGWSHYPLWVPHREDTFTKSPFIKPSLINPLRVSSPSCQNPPWYSSPAPGVWWRMKRCMCAGPGTSLAFTICLFCLQFFGSIINVHYVRANVLYAIGCIIRFLRLKIGVITLCYKDLNNNVLEIQEEFYFTTRQAFCFLITQHPVI